MYINWKKPKFQNIWASIKFTVSVVVLVFISSLALAEPFESTNLREIPPEARSLYKGGKDAFALSAYDLAIDSFKRAVEIQSPFPDAHLLLGRSYEAKGQLDDARRQYKIAIQQAPEYAMAHFHLGILADKQDRRVEAEAHYQKTIHINPKFSEAYSNLGALYIKQGKVEKAEEVLLKSLELGSNAWNTRSHLGNVYFQKGEFQKALGFFQEVEQENPDDLLNLMNLGNTYLALGKEEEAQKSFEHLLEIKPDSQPGKMGLGLVYYSRKDFDKAISLFEDLSQGKNSDPKAGFFWARSLSQSKQKDGIFQALAIMQRVVENNPQYHEARYHLVLLYEANNRNADARYEKKQLKKFAPTWYQKLSEKQQEK